MLRRGGNASFSLPPLRRSLGSFALALVAEAVLNRKMVVKYKQAVAFALFYPLPTSKSNPKRTRPLDIKCSTQTQLQVAPRAPHVRFFYHATTKMPPPPFTQMFPPRPTFAEEQLGSLAGKTCLVTGTTSGMGFELARMIYAAGGTVFMGARSEDRNAQCIQTIQASCPDSQGSMIHLSLDVSDLAAVKRAAGEFLAQADRLDVLVHNAGIMTPPAGSTDGSGRDLEMATNCLGPFLLTRLLEPLLVRTARVAPRDSVRIVWLSSMVAVSVPRDGILWDDATGHPKVLKDAMQNYMQSKVGSLFFAREYVDRLGKDGVLSLVRSSLAQALLVETRLYGRRR